MKQIRKDSRMWILFEQLFLQRHSSSEDEILGPMPRGSAINLAMGLNVCQAQWQREGMLPNEMLIWSAKAKAGIGECEGQPAWIVEISRNHAKQGRAKPSAVLDNLLAMRSNAAEMQAPRTPSTDDNPDRIPTPEEAAERLRQMRAEREMREAQFGDQTALGSDLRVEELLPVQPMEKLTREEYKELERFSEEFDAAWESKREANKMRLKLLEMPFERAWHCVRCETDYPNLGKSVLIEDNEKGWIRICEECVGKLAVKKYKDVHVMGQSAPRNAQGEII
jgi:hypothetical protein